MSSIKGVSRSPANAEGRKLRFRIKAARSRLRAFITHHPVRILVVGGLIASVLGFWGYVASGSGFLDSAYNTLLLFTLNYIPPDEGAPAPLQIARFLAPAVTAGAAIAALFAALRDEADVFWAHRAKNHILICGAGDRGLQFAREFHSVRQQVVVIENDPESPGIRSLRADNILVLVADARDALQLRRARAERASRIICVTGSDDDNAAIVSALMTISPTVNPQDVHSHVSSPVLDSHFTARSSGNSPEGRTIEWFNLERWAATALLSEHFATLSEARRNEDPRGFAVIGASDTGRSLIIEAAKQWGSLSRTLPAGESGLTAPLPRLPVTILDRNVEPWLAEVQTMFKGIDSVLDIETISQKALASEWDPAMHDVCFVAIDNPIEALETAHHLEAQRSGSAQIVVRVFVGAGGLADALEMADSENTIHMVNVVQKTCTVDLVEHSLVAQLARENHSIYQEKIPGLPASHPWEDLSEADRQSNLRAASHHINKKLPKLGLTIVPITDLRDIEEPVSFSESDIETLAKLEHDRWWDEKKSLGFRYADIPDQDRKNRLHPDMIPWDELSDEAKEKDRMFVKKLPATLNACGYRICKA